MKILAGPRPKRTTEKMERIPQPMATPSACARFCKIEVVAINRKIRKRE